MWKAKRFPRVPETPISRPADSWVLWQASLLCGDADSGTEWKRLLGDVCTLLMVYRIRLTGATTIPAGAKRGRRDQTQRQF